jgi:hypothetical protein
MDDREKKLFAQLDDPMAGQRANALELLREHMQKKTPPELFCGWVSDLEAAAENKAEADALRQQNAALDAELARWKAAVTKWQTAYVAKAAKLAAASAVAWGRTTGRKLAAYIAVPVIAVGVWQGSVRYWPLPAAVNDGLRGLATSVQWGTGCSDAIVRQVGGAPYWVIVCGRTDTTSHMNAEGQPVGLHCVDVYATPATADWREYIKANPYGLFGWWINWPRRAVQCEPFPLKEAQK